VISDIDLYDYNVRRKLPPGTIWVRPGTTYEPYVTNIAGEMVISVPHVENQTFQSFRTALGMLESVKRYRDVDWVAVSPFGKPEAFTALQMRNAYVDFANSTPGVYKYPPINHL
jgi:hypothetical protein